MASPHRTRTAPQRIQLKRTKGWRKPEGAIVVSRPSKWGSPFVVGQYVTPPIERYQPGGVLVQDTSHAVKLYRKWLTGSANRIDNLIPELRGHDLACWCPLDQPCHADVLLELANS